MSVPPKLPPLLGWFIHCAMQPTIVIDESSIIPTLWNDIKWIILEQHANYITLKFSQTTKLFMDYECRWNFAKLKFVFNFTVGCLLGGFACGIVALSLRGAGMPNFYWVARHVKNNFGQPTRKKCFTLESWGWGLMPRLGLELGMVLKILPITPN